MIGSSDITVRDIYNYARKGGPIEIEPSALERMRHARNYVHKIVDSGKTVYGINSGFGALANTSIGKDQLEELQYNLIRSHCAGVGKPFSPQVTRAIMFIRAHCLTQGHSGVSLHCVQRIVDMLSRDILPIIPEQGSVGASGDLAPLSQLALTLIGEGEVLYQGKKQATAGVLRQLGWKPVKLGAKDGLALINGTAIMTALGVMAWGRGMRWLNLADVIGAATTEAVQGSMRAFDPRIHRLRPHPGQMKVAARLTELLSDSQNMEDHKDCNRVQDAYSIRCMPQVHGAARDTFEHARNVLDREIHSVTDNPLVFPDDEDVISGGNFHGQPIAYVLDFMTCALADMSNISERRVEKLMNKEFSGLPPFLAKNPGPESGLMIAHVTSAALASENKIFAFPSSVDTISTSTDKEDHVSMGVTSGRKLHMVLRNFEYSLSVELLCANQGVMLREPNTVSPKLAAFLQQFKEISPRLEGDRVLNIEIENIRKLLNSSALCLKPASLQLKDKA